MSEVVSVPITLAELFKSDQDLAVFILVVVIIVCISWLIKVSPSISENPIVITPKKQFSAKIWYFASCFVVCFLLNLFAIAATMKWTLPVLIWNILFWTFIVVIPLIGACSSTIKEVSYNYPSGFWTKAALIVMKIVLIATGMALNHFFDKATQILTLWPSVLSLIEASVLLYSRVNTMSIMARFKFECNGDWAYIYSITDDLSMALCGENRYKGRATTVLLKKTDDMRIVPTCYAEFEKHFAKFRYTIKGESVVKIENPTRYNLDSATIRVVFWKGIEPASRNIVHVKNYLLTEWKRGTLKELEISEQYRKLKRRYMLEDCCISVKDEAALFNKEPR